VLALALVFCAGCSFLIPPRRWHPVIEDGDTRPSCPSYVWPAVDAVAGIAGVIGAVLLMRSPEDSQWLVPTRPDLGRAVIVPSLIYVGSSIYGFWRARDCNGEMIELEAARPGASLGL